MAERSKRGFASMDPEKQRQIASKGGKAAHAKGTAHEFTREEAVEAGRKGGKAAHARGTAHRLTPQGGEAVSLTEPVPQGNQNMAGLRETGNMPERSVETSASQGPRQETPAPPQQQPVPNW